MSNYQNGTIYKIVCKDPEITECYVGSTTSHSKRKSRHKSSCNNEKSKDYNYPVYRYIRDNGGWDNWEFVLLEDYPCRTKKQLNIRERYWFEKLGAKLNSIYPERSKEEYNKEYREGNKEEISEYNKKHYENNKEKIKERNKKNKEKIKERKIKYYEDNKEEILEKMKEKVECECGSVVRKDYLLKHKRTQKHQKWEKTQVE
jgi:hypothetical protein